MLFVVSPKQTGQTGQLDESTMVRRALRSTPSMSPWHSPPSARPGSVVSAHRGRRGVATMTEVVVDESGPQAGDGCPMSLHQRSHLASICCVVVAVTALSCAGRGVDGVAPQWTSDRRIVAVPVGAVVQWPSLAAKGDTVYVTGNVMRPDGARPPSFVIARIPGDTIPAPSDASAFAFPHTAIDRAGRLHLVWGETDSDSSGTLDFTRPITAIWHAVYAGGRWSTPTRLSGGFKFYWSAAEQGLAADSGGSIHLVVSGVDSLGRHSTVYHRWANGTWRSERVAGKSFSSSILALTGDSIVILFAGPLQPDSPHVWLQVMRGSRDGEPWTVPRAIARLSDVLRLRPQLAAAGQTLHVFASDNGTFLPDSASLEHWISTDGGTTWVIGRRAPLPPGTIRITPLVNACNVSLITESLRRSDTAFISTVFELRLDPSGHASTIPIGAFQGSAHHGALAKATTLRVALTVVRSDTSMPRALLASRASCGIVPR
jgi:hypothetical protein